MNNFIIKNKNNIIDDNSILSILIAQNGLSYYIWSENNNIIEEISFVNCKDDTKDFLKSFLLENNLLNKNFKKIICINANNKSTIIPNELFINKEKELIFSTNFDYNKENEDILINKCQQTKNIILFSIDKNIYQYIKESFQTVEFYSSAYSFIENSYLINKVSQERERTKVFLQFFFNYFEIAIIKEEKLFLYNTYKFKSDNDIIYYVMNIFDQLKLSQNESEIMLSGLIDKTNSAVFMLKKFLRLVYFSPIDTSIRYNYHYTEQQPHYLFYFINNLKCVL